MIMTTFDFSPLYRSSIGFDRLASLIDAATHSDHGQTTYPPYNIEKADEDHYRITMAVAGFTQEDLSIESKSNQLMITGTKHNTNPADSKEYLHRGIAERSFEHRFQLADFVRVEGANLENGLLHVKLLRELPEAMKPKTIAIQTTSSEHLIESEKKQAA